MVDSNISRLSSASRVGGWTAGLIDLAAGCAVWLALAGVFARRAAELGYDSRLTWLYAGALALQLELLLLPLGAQLRLRPDGAGVWGATLRLWLGGTIAGLSLSAAGVPAGAWLAARGVLLAVLLLIAALGQAAAAWSGRPVWARAIMALSAALLAGGMFWTGGLREATADPTGRRWLTEAAVWLSPGTLAAKCLPTADIALLPRLYNLWLGPLPPYPARPGLVGMAGYGLAAVAIWGIARAGFRWRRCAGTAKESR